MHTNLLLKTKEIGIEVVHNLECHRMLWSTDVWQRFFIKICTLKHARVCAKDHTIKFRTLEEMAKAETTTPPFFHHGRGHTSSRSEVEFLNKMRYVKCHLLISNKNDQNKVGFAFFL